MTPERYRRGDVLRSLVKSKLGAAYGWAVGIGLCVWFGIDVGWWQACLLFAVAFLGALVVRRVISNRRV
jgi:hypothetical protein